MTFVVMKVNKNAIKAAVNLFISGIYWLLTQNYVKSAFRK